MNPKATSSCWSMLLRVILLFSLSLLMTPTSIIASSVGNETDRYSLLKFKESISNDPHGVFSSWNDSIHFCNWPGIACGSRHQRITALNLDGHDLRGTLSPFIGNLSFLRFINFENNSFYGEIPQQVGRLFRLQHLNLSNNMLEGNLPVNLSYCSELRILSLGNNRLVGKIPLELGSLGKLVLLSLGRNNFTGGIPPSLGNISSLSQFSLPYNNLVGTIPDELGRLKSLTLFSVAVNYLSGVIPFSLFNISSLMILKLGINQFHGTIPPNIGLRLPNLQIAYLDANKFSGTIPESFSNASQLQQLDIGGNNFVGQVPTGLGNLPNLQGLFFKNNSLGGYSSSSLAFIDSLTNCSQFEILDLSANSFGGVLPYSVANLSTRLTMLYVGLNQISGNIPPTLENLVNLITLSLRDNLFTGVIPASLGKFQNLQLMSLASNSLSGQIPSTIGNLTQIFKLYLSNNQLEGSIPSNIAGCQNLQYLDISKNRLSKSIPKEVFFPSSFLYLDLSRNSLSGNLPVEVGKLKNINTLDVSENNLSSEIPKAIGDCQSLEVLSLQGNFFEGTIPATLGSLRGLQYLDLSRNNLTGEIPIDLQNLTFLVYLNLSFNHLEGEVPNKGVFQKNNAVSLTGNNKLCGGGPILQLPPCPIKAPNGRKTKGPKLTIIIVCVAALFLLLSSFIIFYWRRKSTRKSFSTLSTIGFIPQVSYERLYQATNGFSPSMLIGTGGFGSVYKGILDHFENPVAVKVLDFQHKEAEKSFVAECNALRNVRHRNLVKILTCCSSIDYKGNNFKALVFEYMSNGSLEKWLHQVNDATQQSRDLNLIQRLNIASDVASAIYYLHEDCDQPIIHCDLKPSNILLDEEMTAHVSDFGLARLLSNTTAFFEGQSSTTGIKGTIGYAAPEYAMGGKPSKQGDVYSYGILVLEMFIGRRPTDKMFKDDFNLHNFIKMALPERLVEIVDSSLLLRDVEETTEGREDERRYSNNESIEIDSEEENIDFEKPNEMSVILQECLVSVLEIGLACSEESQNERMNMGDVIKELQHIRNGYLGVGIHGQRLRTS